MSETCRWRQKTRHRILCQEFPAETISFSACISAAFYYNRALTLIAVINTETGLERAGELVRRSPLIEPPSATQS